MAQQQSKLPSDWELSRAQIAYLQNIESRRPSDMTTLDPGTATLADVVNALNQLKTDLNR